MSIRNAGEIATDAVRQAIKAERARVRRMVRKVKAKYATDTELSASVENACDDILATLKGAP